MKHLLLSLMVVVLFPVAGVYGEQPDEFTFNFYLENDGGVVKPNHDTDRYYTNGLKITVTHHPQLADRLADLLDSILPLGGEPTQTAMGYAIGQKIYTPDHIELTALQPGDRPYAGWLYGGAFLQRQSGDVFDHLELNIGVIGPSSLAEDAQNWIHDLFGTDEARGWSNQLHDELGIDLIYRRKWRITVIERENSTLRGEIIPQAGFTLGNVHRHVEGGAVFRIGCHMPDDFGPGRLEDLVAATARRGEQQVGGYAFVGGQVRYVDHNVFLEGNNDHDSHDVDEKSVIGQIMVGVVVNWRRFSISYTQVFVTREFDGQDGTHSYGSILASFRKDF